MFNDQPMYSNSELPDWGPEPVSNLPGELATPTSATVVWSFFKNGSPQTAIAVSSSKEPQKAPGNGGSLSSNAIALERGAWKYNLYQTSLLVTFSTVLVLAM
jgi:hypothetical protein